MSEKQYINKLKEFKKYIGEFVKYKKEGVEDVHSLRVKGRELFSLLSSEEPLRKNVKKVIKTSNEIRDIDVFVENYIESLPKKHIAKLDMKSIIDAVNKNRGAEVSKLHEYLSSLTINNQVKFIEKEQEMDAVRNVGLEFEQSELHKYRIYIKKMLFREKNALKRDEKKITLLTKIKDVLGDINDNSNGLKRLSEYDIEESLFKSIDEFTHKKNLKLFKEFKKLNDKYMKALL